MRGLAVIDCATRAAISDMFEIKSSQMAIDKADAPTTAFATKMVADTQKTSSELKALLKTVPAVGRRAEAGARFAASC